MKVDLKALDSALAAVIARMDLPGVSVALWGPEGECFSKGYGKRTMDGAQPVDPDTVFGIASMSKSQTALCCAILESEGKLSFDDPVYRYFPRFDLPGTARDAITLRHLAMHTAGIPPVEVLEWSIAMHGTDPEDEPLRQSAPNAFDTIDQIIDYLAKCPHPMLGAPGEYMSYCNEGYALLSYAVDQAAGMPLEQFLQARVYGPLGMTRTVLDVDASEAKALSGGNITSLFERKEGVLSCDDEWSVLPPYRGCGLVKSTARDMAVYYRCLSNWGMHEGRQVLPRQAVERMVGHGFAVQRVPVYALGLNKREHDGHILCEHSGGLHGVSSHGALLLGEGYGMAALCNLGGEDVQQVVWPMLNWAMEGQLDASLRWFSPIGRAFSNPEMMVGTYRSHEGIPVDVTIYRKQDALIAKKDGKDMALSYCGGTLFAHFDEKDEAALRVEGLLRDGRAWGIRVGTRIYQRVEQAQ